MGICLCPAHLCEAPNTANTDSVLAHIEHFYALGGEDCLALGCDLDGTDLPKDMHDIRDLVPLTGKLAALGMNTDDITYGNAYRFMKKVLK